MASGYFTMESQKYHSLLSQVQRDRWSVNWADHFQHFFLKMLEIDLAFNFSDWNAEDNRLHFYWDGQDWYYLYVYDAQTHNFVEGITTDEGQFYFRQGQGKVTFTKLVARIHQI